jgi:hypothetical protein
MSKPPGFAMTDIARASNFDSSFPPRETVPSSARLPR